MDLPFTQENFNNHIIRTFSKDVETDELKWHFDNENRRVTILEGDGWQFQMDDELPVELKVGTVHNIPKGVYHRIKRGINDLKIKIEFYE
jgi:quercetin dioxygenase-like cupin family protein